MDLDELPSDENSLGRQIFVRLGTTGQEFPEFLVHPEFLIKEARQVGLDIMDGDEFRLHFKYLTQPLDTITSNIPELSDIYMFAKTLHKNRDYESLLNFSSLNNYYVFVKQYQKPTQDQNLHQGGGNKSRPRMELSKPIEIKINKNCVENALFRRELLGDINTTPSTIEDNLPKF